MRLLYVFADCGAGSDTQKAYLDVDCNQGDADASLKVARALITHIVNLAKEIAPEVSEDEIGLAYAGLHGQTFSYVFVWPDLYFGRVTFTGTATTNFWEPA